MIVKFVFCSFFIIPLLRGEAHFGYIVNFGRNIGDDIQSIAVKRFLPTNSVSIDREHVNGFTSDTKINAVISGWFMHDKNYKWGFLKPLPIISWPISSMIKPFFISIHFTPTFLQTVFADQHIDYLRQHAPIGARDFFTLTELQKRNIPSYFSGCLTLTLDNPYKERNNIIYLVDVDQKCEKYIKSKVKSPVVSLSHQEEHILYLSLEERFQYAEEILELYRKAKCVITTRLHASMPCLAFKTPVLVIHQGSVKSPRFGGLTDHTRSCSIEELCDGKIDYNFDNPPENPTSYIPIRENLIKIMTKWVQDTSHPLRTH
jgi:hypothetical protein